jgi:hypothetical protein
MMATTPEDPDEERKHVGEEARELIERARVTITGSRDRTLRLVVILMIAVVCIAAAPWPLNAIGMGALMLLTFDIGRNRK